MLDYELVKKYVTYGNHMAQREIEERENTKFDIYFPAFLYDLLDKLFNIAVKLNCEYYDLIKIVKTCYDEYNGLSDEQTKLVEDFRYHMDIKHLQETYGLVLDKYKTFKDLYNILIENSRFTGNTTENYTILLEENGIYTLYYHLESPICEEKNEKKEYDLSGVKK